MNGTFYEQLGGVTGVFEQWGACERTVVLCALARRVPWSGLKMLQRSVEAALAREAPCVADCERLEREANDEAVLAKLLASGIDTEDSDEGCVALQRLVALVPLVRGDRERAMEALVAAAPALVQRSVDNPRRTSPDFTRQLLTYLLVHPALAAHTHHQRTLTQWLRYLENHISGNPNTDSLWPQRTEPPLHLNVNIWGSNGTFRRTIGKNIEFRNILDSVNDQYTDHLQESFSKNGRDVDISIEEDRLSFDVTISQPKSQRSNSLTPPTTNFMHMSSSAENLNDEPFVQKPRSFSLSSEHSLGQMRPIGVMYGTTGSETRLDDLRTYSCKEPGMSTVGPWLKGLRLHKYVWLFSNISYERMMTMDEEYLEKLGVTKGARHKLLLSIKKLNEREGILESMERGVVTGGVAGAGGAARVLQTLRALLLTPMPPVSTMPATIVRLLEIVSKALLSYSGGGGEVPGEEPPHQFSELEHTAVDPISLHCWLVEKALHHESFTRPDLSEALERMRYRLPPSQFYHRLSDMPPAPRPRPPPPRWRAPPAPRPKSHSYPTCPPPAPPRRPPLAPDIHSSLDALCLQMTERAIN